MHNTRSDATKQEKEAKMEGMELFFPPFNVSRFQDNGNENAPSVSPRKEASGGKRRGNLLIKNINEGLGRKRLHLSDRFHHFHPAGKPVNSDPRKDLLGARDNVIHQSSSQHSGPSGVVSPLPPLPHAYHLFLVVGTDVILFPLGFSPWR